MHVMEREHVQEHVGGLPAPCVLEQALLRREVLVGDDRAFGLPGGAARVELKSGVVVVVIVAATKMRRGDRASVSASNTVRSGERNETCDATSADVMTRRTPASSQK